MAEPLSDRRIAVLCFLSALAIYLANGDVQPGHDPRASVELPVNVLDHGRVTFAPEDWPAMFVWDRRQDGSLQLRRPAYYLAASKQVDARGEPLYVSLYGIGAGLTALPVYVAARAAGFNLDEPRTRWHLGKFVAALCAAGAVALAFLIARFRLPARSALWVAIAVGFGTCVWSSSSQALWQHGPSELFLVLGTWCLLHPSATPWLRAAAGASYAWAVLCRPTGLVVLGLAGIYVLLYERRMVLAYAAGALPFVLVLAGYNTHYFGSPCAFGQLADAAAPQYRVGEAGPWATPFWQGAAGQLLSPSRGMLVYSPFLAATLLGIWVAWRSPGERAFRALSVIALAFLCADMKWSNWWGGWSYGYRLKADAVVLVTLLLIPAMPLLLRHAGVRMLFLFALVWSIGVQALGAWAYDFDGWNNRLYYQVSVPGRATPVVLTPEQTRRVTALEGATVLGPLRANIDDPVFRQRLWSIGDSQILYYATHYAEARARRHQLMEDIWSADGPRGAALDAD